MVLAYHVESVQGLVCKNTNLNGSTEQHGNLPEVICKQACTKLTLIISVLFLSCPYNIQALLWPVFTV